MFFIIFLWSQLAANGDSHKLHKRLVDSPDCAISKHPYMVSMSGSNFTAFSYSLESYTYHFYGSSGVLITSKHILTDSMMIMPYIDHFQAGSNLELPSQEGIVSKMKEQYDYLAFKIEDKSAKDYLRMILVDPEFKSSKIQPAKLPPSRGFVDTCEELTVVGWGVEHEEIASKLEKQTKQGTFGLNLKCAKASLKKCTNESDTTIFCYVLLEGRKLCRYDRGLAVMCKDFLVGITTEPEESLPFNKCSNEVIGRAVNLSHFTKWIREKSGVQVAFEATPDRDYKRIPESTPSTSTKEQDKNISCSVNEINVILLSTLVFLGKVLV